MTPPDKLTMDQIYEGLKGKDKVTVHELISARSLQRDEVKQGVKYLLGQGVLTETETGGTYAVHLERVAEHRSLRYLHIPWLP